MESYQYAIGHMEVRPIWWNKMQFFPSSSHVKTTMWMHHMEAKWEKAWQQLHKYAMSCIEQILEATSHKTAAVCPPTTPSQKPSKLDKQDM